MGEKKTEECAEAGISKFINHLYIFCHWLEIKCLTSLGESLREDAPLPPLLGCSVKKARDRTSFSAFQYVQCAVCTCTCIPKCVCICIHFYIFSTDVSSFVGRWWSCGCFAACQCVCVMLLKLTKWTESSVCKTTGDNLHPFHICLAVICPQVTEWGYCWSDEYEPQILVTLGHRNPSGPETPPEWKAFLQNGRVQFEEGREGGKVWGSEWRENVCLC